jgi:hypothetical protein
MRESFATALASFLVVSLWVGGGAALENEPTGYGKAAFGSSVTKVRELYPGMKELSGSESLGEPIVQTPNITRYVLRDQPLDGEKIDVELRFWKDQLWFYVGYFDPKDADRVASLLSKRHGPPDRKTETRVLWNGDKTMIVELKSHGRFTVQDKGVSRQAQTWFMDALKASRRPRTLKRSPQPSAQTPVPTAKGSSGAAP